MERISARGRAVSIISGQEIWRRIFSEEVEEDKRLVITPLLDPQSQIQKGSSSVDVRLGNHFIVQTRRNVSHLDPGEKKIHESQRLLENRIIVPFGKYLVLHPNQFALGGTLEYLRVPLDLSGYLVGRSSWGRLGLIVATAIGIHPGFRGIVTLELRNMGEVPFYLRPGQSLAQIFFHTIEGDVEKTGVRSPYIGSVVPESSRLGPDRDLELVNLLGGEAPAEPLQGTQ